MKTLVTLVIVLLSSIELQAQPLVLDLGTLDPGDTKVISENRNVRFDKVILKNKLHYDHYSIWSENEFIILDPLELNDVKSLNVDEENRQCQPLIILYNSYKTSVNNRKYSEIDLSFLIESLQKEIKNCRMEIENSDGEVKMKYLDFIRDVELYIKHFEEEKLIEINVRTGETVRIFVKSSDKLWTFVLTGKLPGKWVTTYGFGFTSRRFESSTYFTKQVSDSEVFRITKSKRQDYLDLDFVPTVFFSYFPSQNFRTLNHGFSAGLGFDSVNPIVFVGYNFTYRHNIGITSGIAFQQQYRLKDQYSINETIAVTLDKDQLHDKIYRLNIFISVNFRFAENPFNTTRTDLEE